MTKRKRKLTPAEKAAKKRRHLEYEYVFLNGKQKRVKRAPIVEGLPEDEFVRRNADPICLLQDEMFEELHEWQQNQHAATEPARRKSDSEDNIPF